MTDLTGTVGLFFQFTPGTCLPSLRGVTPAEHRVGKQFLQARYSSVLHRRQRSSFVQLERLAATELPDVLVNASLDADQ